ncbi:MAG: Tfx family DNA-binding protein [Methanothrix sp.]|nr:Tfx family DNA-binding protein [Methanothrix sp.]
MSPQQSHSPLSNPEDAESAGVEASDSFLTQRQLKVLQMRLAGLSQQEVADSLGTTRSNISILEKRAHQNIARAERTLQQWMMLRAPISLQAQAGTDVFELPKMIFAAADEKEIRLPITSLDIVVQLRRKAPRLFKKRALEKRAQIYVTEEGELLVEESL